MKKNSAMLIAFVSPAAIFFILIFLYPILRTLLMSFFRIEGVTDGLAKWQFVGFFQLWKAVKYDAVPHFYVESVSHLAFWRNDCALPGTAFCRHYHFRNPWKKLFPRYDIPSEYCLRRSPCNHVATICLQSEIRSFEELFHTSPSAETRVYSVAE